MIARSRAIGLALVVASVLALVMSLYSSYQSRRYASCQSAVSEALIQATNARAAAAEQDRRSDQDESAATAELIRTVFTVQTPAERIAAYGAYRKALDEINAHRATAQAERVAHPLPAPPSQTCR